MDSDGWSFVLQPVLAFAECADELSTHPHHPLVQSVACMFGWTQIMPYQELAHHFRSRWLCVCA